MTVYIERILSLVQCEGSVNNYEYEKDKMLRQAQYDKTSRHFD